MMTSKELNVLIGRIRKSAGTLRDNIQTALVNAAGHAYEHGDVTAFAKLFDATSGANRKLIVKYIHTYGFAMIQKDGTFKANKSARKSADFESGSAVVEYLTNEVPAWYVEEQSAAQIKESLDIAKAIAALTKRIASADDVKTQGAHDALKGLEAALSSKIRGNLQVAA